MNLRRDRPPLLLMPICEHQDFAISANVGRHTAGEGGPVFSFTCDITLKCTDCNLAFHFGTQPRRSDDGLELKLRVGPGSIADGEYCPGQYRCPICLFRLTSKTLDAKTGAVGADKDRKSEPCPNGCDAILEKLTWQESANEAHESAHQIMLRALAAEARIEALELAWPDNAAMPAELLTKYDPFAGSP